MGTLNKIGLVCFPDAVVSTTFLSIFTLNTECCHTRCPYTLLFDSRTQARTYAHIYIQRIRTRNSCPDSVVLLSDFDQGSADAALAILAIAPTTTTTMMTRRLNFDPINVRNSSNGGNSPCDPTLYRALSERYCVPRLPISRCDGQKPRSRQHNLQRSDARPPSWR